MQNFKSVALIRQINEGYSDGEIRGVARLLKKDKTFGLSLSITNLLPAKNGEYLVWLENAKYQLNDLYGGFFDCNSDYNGGIAIVFKSQDGFKPIAYGKFSQNAKTVWEMIDSEKNHAKKEEVSAQKTTVFSSQEYDDFAIAEDDYFANERREKGELEDGGEKCGSQDFNCNSQDIQQEEKESSFASSNSYENDDCSQNEFYPTYYERIKDKLESVFSENPKEECLEKMVGHSRWARVGDGANSFVVGVISINGVPRYICYGLLGSFYSKPSEIKSYASFIPKSPFNLKGEGYWVMFQSAINGESDK